MPGNELKPSTGGVQEQREGDDRIVAAAYSGPIPPPEWMESYEQFMPGTGAQIMAMAKSEQDHRHKMERRALWLNYGDSLLGKVLVGCAIATIAYLVMNGHNIIPAILATLIAAGPVSKLVRWIARIAGGGNGG